MQVLGNLKGVFTAVVSVLIFQNKVTVQGVIGYSITIFGGVIYQREKNNGQGLEGWSRKGLCDRRSGKWIAPNIQEKLLRRACRAFIIGDYISRAQSR
jgi:hypothetical protein